MEDFIETSLGDNLLFEKIFWVLFTLSKGSGRSDIERIVSFIKDHLSGEEEDEVFKCPVCLEDKTKGIRNHVCDHMLCKKCYYGWMNIKVNCPCCRANPFSLRQSLPRALGTLES